MAVAATRASNDRWQVHTMSKKVKSSPQKVSDAYNQKCRNLEAGHRMDEKICYYKTNTLLWCWSEGEGARIVYEASLSMEKAPPKPVDSTTRKISLPKYFPPKKSASEIFDDLEKIGSVFKRFKTWADAADSPKPSKASPARSEMTVPPFDIQEIPGAMRNESMPISAKLMERWFAGDLNYSPTEDAENSELNQDGKPYPESMIDRTSIEMDWVIKFDRAREQYHNLIAREIFSPNAKQTVKDVLSRYRNSPGGLLPWTLCEFDLLKLHRTFQFQRVGVESSFEQKALQAIRRMPMAEVPDDLTGALGSFVLYAAIAGVEYDSRRESAKVTHIVVYVKDHYTFGGAEESKSQYLGHWSKKGVIVVPAYEAANLAGMPWLDYPVILGGNASADLYKEGKVYYPVRNRSFREWRRRHRRGGDFIVLSNHKSIRLERPIEVYFS